VRGCEASIISAERVRAPDARFVLRHPAHFVALGGGIGLIPFAPGTFGTLLALPIFWLAGPRIDPVIYFGGLALLFGLGVWACEITGRNLGSADHGSMVWDETVAFLLVLFFTPVYSYWQAFAFLLFRLFDITKPPPIRYYERTFKGGLGVMIDDIAAAFYALLVLAVARAIVA
jgi:phosphatidylglycerophosphatase A